VLAALAAGAGVVAAVAGPTAGAQSERGGAQPNVVVVMTDDQRADDLRVMRQVQQLIARRGTKFVNTFATFPLCCPSRATYVTGQYAHNHNVLANALPLGGVTRLDDTNTVATDLQDAGYRTGWIGKYLNGYGSLGQAEPPVIPPGYDVWQPIVSLFVAYGWKQLLDEEVFEWGKTTRDYATDVYARQAKQFLRSSAKEAAPFFLTVAPNPPHRELGGAARYNPRPAKRHKDLLEGHPFPKTKAFNEFDVSDKPSFVRNNLRYTRNQARKLEKQRLARRESLLAVDDLVNSVIRTLRKLDELSNTLVVFTSDNGFHYGEHRLGSKNTVYEESIRVPLLMRGPGVPADRTVRSPAANLDLPATIYDLTGVDPTLTQDGISLFDLIAEPAQYADRELLIQTTRSLALRTPGYLYAEHDSDPETPQTDDELELYDLAADPYQLESLHDDVDPEIIALRLELADRLDDLRGCEGAECH
jgi:arylsulfatase A-like enzyme